MGSKAKMKLVTDLLMTVLLLLLMAFDLVGRAAHEWIGMGLFALFIPHHILNGGWSRAMFRGKYTPLRVIQTALAGAVFLCMIGMMVSAVIISDEVFAFLNIRGRLRVGRTLHMLSAYWGFVLMSLHLGIHWNGILHRLRKLRKKPPRGRSVVPCVSAAAVALYGVLAFVRRELPLYMTLRSHFVFFDYEEPLVFFFLDYLSIMGLFAWAGYHLVKPLQKQAGKNDEEKNPRRPARME